LIEKGFLVMPRKSSKRTDKDQAADGFQQQAAQKPSSLASELFRFILHNKKWWLTPIIIVILLLGLIAFLSGTGAAPFIYTLF
jgi:hypothetical protein